MAYVSKSKMDEFVSAEMRHLTKMQVEISLSKNKTIDEILADVKSTVTNFLEDITAVFGPIATVTNHIESGFLKEANDKAVLLVMSKKCGH